MLGCTRSSNRVRVSALAMDQSRGGPSLPALRRAARTVLQCPGQQILDRSDLKGHVRVHSLALGVLASSSFKRWSWETEAPPNFAFRIQPSGSDAPSLARRCSREGEADASRRGTTRKRRHSTPGYVSPAAYDAQLQAAA